MREQLRKNIMLEIYTLTTEPMITLSKMSTFSLFYKNEKLHVIFPWGNRPLLWVLGLFLSASLEK